MLMMLWRGYLTSCTISIAKKMKKKIGLWIIELELMNLSLTLTKVQVPASENRKQTVLFK